MRYKNGFYVNVGDIAIKDNSDTVLVTSINECDYFNKTNGGDMENKKVIINNDMQDFVMVCSAIRQLDDATKRLKDIEEFSKDKLLVDMAEYTVEDLNKILKQLEGYLDDNYELV